MPKRLGERPSISIGRSGGSMARFVELTMSDHRGLVGVALINVDTLLWVGKAAANAEHAAIKFAGMGTGEAPIQVKESYEQVKRLLEEGSAQEPAR
jgi:hypothetical protein